MIGAAEYSTVYLSQLQEMLGRVEATTPNGQLPYPEGVERAVQMVKETHAAGGKLLFIGNGASAAISSHQAADFIRAASVPAFAFNDAPLITCLGNDLGYERVFEVPVGLVGKPGDLLIAISSSGASPNILRGADRGREVGCRLLTLSGFKADNPLRAKGDLSFWVPTMSYGKVEVIHLAILHCICDCVAGR